MKSFAITVCGWWALIAMIFIMPYLIVSIQLDAGFNVSDWDESHRSTYVLSVYMTAILSLGTAVLDEFFNRR